MAGRGVGGEAKRKKMDSRLGADADAHKQGAGTRTCPSPVAAMKIAPTQSAVPASAQRRH